MLKDAVPLEQCRRALVIKLRHHGDVLLAAPVLSVLKAHAPRLEIDALVYEDTGAMLEGHPALSRLHYIGRGWRAANPIERLAAEGRLFYALRSLHFDLLIHLSEHPRGAWLARTLGARWSVAPALPDRGKFWVRSFTHRYPLPKNGRRHQVELNLDALRRIGVQPGAGERRVTFVPGGEATRRADGLLAQHRLTERSFIHMHPASRWRFKCWPAEKNAALLDRLALAGHRIVLTSAPDAEELALIKDIATRTRAPVIDFSGKLSLKELGALTAKARLFIGVDSMPMHLAAAMGTPTLALFGPSGEVEWGPWNVVHRVVASSHTCRPCGNDGCGGGKVSECLTTLAVDDVLAAAHQLLEGA